LIERGSYRVKGASGVFTMRERRGRGSVGQSPPEAEAFFVNECLNFDVLE